VSAWAAAFAFATVTASRVMRAISSAVTKGEAANPTALRDNTHAKPETILVGDKRNLVCRAAAALRSKAIPGELISIAANAKIGVGCALLFRFKRSRPPRASPTRALASSSQAEAPEEPVRQQRRCGRNRRRNKRTAGGFVEHYFITFNPI